MSECEFEKSLFTHDPNEKADFKRDWTRILGEFEDGDTIATSTWTPDDGINVDSDSHDDHTATAKISGGIEGRTHEIVNHIVSATGREFEKTLRFEVKSK